VCSFEVILHDRLMAAIQERISDRHLLKLLRAMLRAESLSRARSVAA